MHSLSHAHFRFKFEIRSRYFEHKTDPNTQDPRLSLCKYDSELTWDEGDYSLYTSAFPYFFISFLFFPSWSARTMGGIDPRVKMQIRLDWIRPAGVLCQNCERNPRSRTAHTPWDTLSLYRAARRNTCSCLEIDFCSAKVIAWSIRSTTHHQGIEKTLKLCDVKLSRSGSEKVFVSQGCCCWCFFERGRRKKTQHNTVRNLHAPHMHSSLEYVCPFSADLIFNP